MPANKTSWLCCLFDWFVTFSTSDYKVVGKNNNPEALHLKLLPWDVKCRLWATRGRQSSCFLFNAILNRNISNGNSSRTWMYTCFIHQYFCYCIKSCANTQREELHLTNWRNCYASTFSGFFTFIMFYFFKTRKPLSKVWYPKRTSVDNQANSTKKCLRPGMKPTTSLSGGTANCWTIVFPLLFMYLFIIHKI